MQKVDAQTNDSITGTTTLWSWLSIAKGNSVKKDSAKKESSNEQDCTAFAAIYNKVTNGRRGGREHLDLLSMQKEQKKVFFFFPLYTTYLLNISFIN